MTTRSAPRTLPELMLTVVEFARVLKVGRTTAYDVIKSGAVPSVLVGKQRRVRWSDALAYVDGLEPSPVARVPAQRASQDVA